MRFVSICILITCLAWSGQSMPTDNEEDAIRTLWLQFESYFEDGDADGVASLYTIDSDRYTNDGRRGDGRDGVKGLYAEIFAGRVDDPPIKKGYHAELKIRFLRPDVAIVDGISKRTPGRTSYFTIVVTKESGEWLISAGRPRGSVMD
jgi:uncharacterized protein (TIGR02246 family)